jgi:hypothetical protein
VDAEPAPITIEAPAPPQPDAAPPVLPAAAPAPEKTEPASSKATAAPPATKRATAVYFEGERTISDAEFAPAPARPTSEVGVGTFLVSGATASGVVGAAPFFSREVSPGFVVRPAVSIAGTEGAQFRATWTAARVDACWRVPEEAPVQLDLCGGAEVGFAYVASGNTPGSPAEGHTLATFDLGPTAALRSEIGRDIAVSLRTGAGVNALRASYLDVSGNEQQAPIVSARFELALSWLFR